MWLLKKLVSAHEACCTFGFIRQWDGWTAQDAADHLGVAEKTIRNWRQAVRKELYTCPYGHECPRFIGIPQPILGKASQGAAQVPDRSPASADCEDADGKTLPNPKK